MAARTFEELCQVVAGAASPEDVFSALQGGGQPGWRQSLASEYAALRALTEGAAFADEGARQGAAIVRQRLEELYREATGDGVGAAGYRDPAPLSSSSPRRTVRTARATYELGEVLARGDLATLHAGRVVEGPGAGRAVVFKLADQPSDNDLLLDEVAALERLHKADGAPRKHLPVLLDHLRTPDGRVGVLLERLEGLDLLEVRQRLPGGVPPEHAIWILRRLLSAVGYAHRLGILHGNIEPSHVLVRPRDHNVFLLDWCYSLIEPGRTGRGFKVDQPGFSAPEVAERKPPIPASDLYSVGRVAVYLLGGNDGVLPATVDERLARLVRHLCRPSPLQRAQDAWEMFEELGKVRRALFGAHRFQEFVV